MAKKTQDNQNKETISTLPELETKPAPNPVKEQIKKVFFLWESAKAQDVAMNQKTALNQAIQDLAQMAGD